MLGAYVGFGIGMLFVLWSVAIRQTRARKMLSGAPTFLFFKTRYTKFFSFSYHSSHKRKHKEYISLSPPQSRVAWQGSLPRAATSCHGG